MERTQKQETFCLNLHKGMSQRIAYIKAGYSSKQSPATIDRHASALAKTDKVVTMLEKLQKEAIDASQATVLERKQILTQIMRATVPDFVTGEDILVTAESPNVRAVAEITRRESKHGMLPVVITNLKLHSPMTAIDLLNKMDKIYDAGASVVIDNRTVNIFVESERGKELTEKLLNGSEFLDDDVHKDIRG